MCQETQQLGKASGHDDICAEHIVNAHPSIVMHLCLLFRSMAVHGFVPDDFGKGIIIPLVKDKAADVNSLNNYRGITLIPVVSKLFELIILEICENKLFNGRSAIWF